MSKNIIMLRTRKIETGILRQARWFLFSSMFSASQASEFLFSTGKLVQAYEARTDSDPAPFLCPESYDVECIFCARQLASSMLFFFLPPGLSSAKPQNLASY